MIDVDVLYIGITCFSVGITFAFGIHFLFLKIPETKLLRNYKKARFVMAVAYITLAVFYVIKLAFHSEMSDMRLSRIITLTVAAAQAFLFTYTLISLINLRFVTKKKVLLELTPIVLLSCVLLVLLYSAFDRVYFNSVFYIYVLCESGFELRE